MIKNSKIILAFLLIFLGFVVYCSFFHNESGCIFHHYLMINHPYEILALLLVFAVFCASSFKIKEIFSVSVLPNFALIFGRFRDTLFWRFDPILEAFRRGIIHPQIYSCAFISG